jgi:hypothetical protein
MANPDDIISQLAAQKLGPAPGAPAPEAGAPPAPSAAPPEPPKADPAPTNMEKAQAKVAPADPQNADPVESFFKVGDREYTKQQVEGTMSRYKDLNFKWQTHKPTVDVITSLQEAAVKAGYEPKPQEIAQLVEAAVRAYVKNPQMGNTDKTGNDTGGGKAPMSGDGDGGRTETFGDDAAYTAWEKENAVKLPPGLRETAAKTQGLEQKLDKMIAMLNAAVTANTGQQQGMVNQAQQTLQAAQGAKGDAAAGMVSNNLSQAFMQAGLPTDPEARADFRMFAAQRGYDFPDFMDSKLTSTVVADYKANKDAPEISRLREVAKRRQAFTGMVEGSPGASGASAAPADPMFASMLDTAMTNKGMR